MWREQSVDDIQTSEKVQSQFCFATYVGFYANLRTPGGAKNAASGSEWSASGHCFLGKVINEAARWSGKKKRRSVSDGRRGILHGKGETGETSLWRGCLNFGILGEKRKKRGEKRGQKKEKHCPCQALQRSHKYQLTCSRCPAPQSWGNEQYKCEWAPQTREGEKVQPIYDPPTLEVLLVYSVARGH